MAMKYLYFPDFPALGPLLYYIENNRVIKRTLNAESFNSTDFSSLQDTFRYLGQISSCQWVDEKWLKLRSIPFE